MKTTTIGRIGAIATGAAMLGTVVAGALAGAVAVPDTLKQSFFYDSAMKPLPQVVIGEKASASDGAAAGSIAAVIGNLAYHTESVEKTGTDTVQCPDVQINADTLGVSCVTGEGESSAAGEVTLSYTATGFVGDVQQRELNASVYLSGDRKGMEMISLDENGDSGNFLNADTGSRFFGNTTYRETYTPESEFGSTNIDACSATAGTSQKLLKSASFENEKAALCYGFCEVSLAGTPHLMSEWLDVYGNNMRVKYDCSEEKTILVLRDDENNPGSGNGALVYTVFTDDIPIDDLFDDTGSDKKLVDQSYRGKMLLGGKEYYVKDIQEDELTLAKGASGVATVAQPMVYKNEAGDEYTIALVGAQTTESEGIVDVTLDVTKPDGTTQQVVAGISGAPTVGDLQIKLVSGTAASNVITGETAYEAALVVYDLDTQIKLEDDQECDATGCTSDIEDGTWTVDFITTRLDQLDDLEEADKLTSTEGLPDGVDENEQYDGGYDEIYQATYNSSKVLRAIRFTLTDDLSESDALSAGDMLTLPFGGEVSLSYLGLRDELYKSIDEVDTTEIKIERKSVEVYGTSGAEEDERETAVVVSYTDRWGTSMNDVRIDEGPYVKRDEFFDGGSVVKIVDIEGNWSDTPGSADSVTFKYVVKDGSSYPSDSDAQECTLSAVSTPVDLDVKSVQADFDADAEYRNTACPGLTGTVYGDVETDANGPGEVLIYVDQDTDGNITVTNGGTHIQTEFDNDVWFYAQAAGVAGPLPAKQGAIVVDGGADTGIVNPVYVYMFNDSRVNLTSSGGAAISLHNDCDDYATADKDGDLIAVPGGAKISIESSENDEVNLANGVDQIDTVTFTIPKNELRPTIQIGKATETETTVPVKITEADVDKTINIGGVDVKVDSFDVTGSFTPGSAELKLGDITSVPGGEAELSTQVSCEETTVQKVGSSMVVVEGSQSSSGPMILIGGPAVNSLTTTIAKADDLKGGKIILSGNKLLVAGYTEDETAKAAADLISWLKANVNA